ncbi:MAG TPA: nucleotidyltransferase family protein [Cyclobacteriaceae bacterium]|nr:nucleotidyltransferase family protein [Cyclobacteriaceae bacterium]
MGGIETLRQDNSFSFSKHLKSMEKLIVSSLSKSYSLQPIQLDEKNLFVLAMSQEVASTIAWNRAQYGGWENISVPWQKAFDETDKRISAYLVELDRVGACFASTGIPLVALKNSGIVRGIYPFPGAVPMGDVDVLVRKQDFRRAHAILLENGYQFEFRSALEEEDIEEAEQGGGAEYWKVLPNGEKLWFELQWRPIAGRWIRPDQEPSADELMARSIPIEGTDVRLLAPEDNLLQVCLHTAKHSYVRAPGLRLHLDVERIVRAYPGLDWSLFMQRVEKLQVKTATYFSLVIPKELFGTPIPDDVLNRLRPAVRKEKTITRLINKAGLFNPHEKKFTRFEYILFNVLLYDDARGLWRGVFPEKAWMKERYAIQHGWQLPYFHLKRLGGLLFRRLAT